MKKLAASVLLLGAAAWTGSARAAACANPCTGPSDVDVHIVYFGATAVNNTINDAAVSLYGDPLTTCTSAVKTYRCRRDLDGNTGNGAETCVQAYVAENKGSCEGVQAMDRKESAFNVCDPGGAGLRSLGGLLDEAGHQLYANFTGADVPYGLCEPVVLNSVVLRPDVFDATEDQAFIIPFSFIANRGIEGVLNARAKTTPPTCIYPGTDCLKLDVNITDTSGKAIFGNNNSCDWRFISKDVDGTVSRTIGTVMRQRLSGTRRNFNATILQNLAPGQGNIYVAGTGDMVTKVNVNDWCGTQPTLCGENQATGTTGGGAPSASCSGTNVISLGYIGTDRLIINDNGSPADPHDDFGIRLNQTDNYDPVKYNGTMFNKAAVRCGRYEYWNPEQLYYDNDAQVRINGFTGYFFPPNSIKEKAVQEWRDRTTLNAAVDPTIVPLADMFFSRARPGAPPFPSAAYNTFCLEP